VHTHSRPLHASIFHAQDVLASSHRELRSRVAALKLSTYIIRDCKRRHVLDQRLHHIWPAMVDSKVQGHLPVRIFHGDLGTVLNEQRNDLGLIGLHRVVDERLMVLREHEERALLGVRGHGYIISKCTCWFRISNQHLLRCGAVDSVHSVHTFAQAMARQEKQRIATGAVLGTRANECLSPLTASRASIIARS